MRCLDRNKTPFYYARYQGRQPVRNESGQLTGEYEVSFSDPQQYYANISPASGETETQPFGDHELYDKVMVLDSFAPQIDETSVLWVDLVPELDADGALAEDGSGNPKTPHDYIVKKVAKSQNSVSLAIKKVTVT